MSVFDGLSGALNDLFGAPVTLFPQAGGQVEIRAVFRKAPINLPDEDGRDLLVVAPTLQVPKTHSDQISRGDVIQTSAGERFRVLANTPISSNPGSDAFVMFEMEEETP